jgi:hypothetical protein
MSVNLVCYIIHPTLIPTIGIEFIDWYPKSSVINDKAVATIANGITDKPEQPNNIMLGLVLLPAANDITEGPNNIAPSASDAIPLPIAIEFTIGLNIIYNVSL